MATFEIWRVSIRSSCTANGWETGRRCLKTPDAPWKLHLSLGKWGSILHVWAFVLCWGKGNINAIKSIKKSHHLGAHKMNDPILCFHCVSHFCLIVYPSLKGTSEKYPCSNCSSHIQVLLEISPHSIHVDIPDLVVCSYIVGAPFVVLSLFKLFYGSRPIQNLPRIGSHWSRPLRSTHLGKNPY